MYTGVSARCCRKKTNETDHHLSRRRGSRHNRRSAMGRSLCSEEQSPISGIARDYQRCGLECMQQASSRNVTTRQAAVICIQESHHAVVENEKKETDRHLSLRRKRSSHYRGPASGRSLCSEEQGATSSAYTPPSQALREIIKRAVWNVCRSLAAAM